MYFLIHATLRAEVNFSFCLSFLNYVYFLLEYFNIYFKSTRALTEIKRANTMRNKYNLGKDKC